MVAPFFEALANQISDRFGLGENTNRSLDIVENGHIKRYGQLGDFANKFDHSSERRYLEEGYLRKDTFNVDPKQFEILMQEPELTVLVKKSMFSSLAENFRPDLMDDQDKLFYKTARILFENKCKQISAFEKLSKIERVSATVGEFDTQMLPTVMTLFDELSSASVSSGGLFSPVQTRLGKLSDVIEKIRKVYAYSPSRMYTTWLKDDKTLFRNQLGEGTGVIELTNVTSIQTTTTVDGNSGGNCTINITDPYQLMLITESDLERALSDATNPMFNHRIFQLGKESSDDIIARNTKLLNDKRRVRGASDITFRVNPDTLLGERVIALVDKVGEKINFTYDAALGLGGLGIGKGVEVSEDCKIGGALLGEEGLNTRGDRSIPGFEFVKRAIPTSEVSIFGDIITAIFNKIQMETNARAVINQKSEKVNYARRKLRFYFLGKRIIQPMDQIHIYIGSKSVFDTKILSGLQQSFNAYGFLKNLDKAFYDFKNSFDTLFNPSGNVDIQLEKSVIVGPNFPNYLWGLMRNQFVNERSGSHVFGGIVTGAKGSNVDGKYSVTITGKDNTAYFDHGYINFKPSADVFNGALYDPLTPFKTKFDTISSNFKNEAPKLLDENEKLLGTKLVRYKLGPNAGRIATSGSLLQDRDIDNKGRARKVLYAPDGLVYRWKEGIGTLVQYGDSFNANDPNRLGAPSPNKDPFAGQDVMNVLSLLITGEPYNFANYYRGLRDSGNLLRDPQTGQDSAFSFYASLRNDLTKRNMNWGNFVAFKTLSMDEETFKKVLDTQLSIINKNDAVDSKLKELLDVKNTLRDINLFKLVPEGDPYKDLLFAKANQLGFEIDAINASTFDALSDQNSLASSFNLVGNDVSYDTDEVLNPGKTNKSLTDGTARRALRRKTNFLTRRLSWKVRTNEDPNLFIVDDYYDKDYDILAFEKSFTDGISAFNSQFITVKQQIFMVAQLLNLEVFCDTQGHIRVRPAQYNKVPSSIFYRMLQLKDEKGIQIFPQFLEDLFVNQIDAMIHKIEIIENQIRFDAAILGKNTDNEVSSFINNGAVGVKNVPNADGTFKFLSNVNTWTIQDARQIIATAHPENKTDIFSTGIIRGQVFGPAQRSQIIKDIFTLSVAGKSPITKPNQDRLNKLRTRLTMDTGQTVSEDNFLQKTETGIVAPEISKSPDVFKIVKDISDRIAERQRYIKAAYNLLKNVKEAKSLDDDKNARNKLVFPNTGKKGSIPEIFECMIEDETNDDLGINSGKRFILKNNVIKSIDDSENPPEYSMIQVSGLLDPNGFATGLPAELNTFASNGNALVSAAAVDYDTWRMYGMRIGDPVNAPFLHNPETQCAPYAAALLSRARKNILQADVVIAGNEYMQPGEVVFVEERGLLYYVQSVSHSFTYGGSFSTSLKLIYGHPPGEYITTPFDVIGKMLYINRDNTDIINYRQQSAFNDNSLGVIVYDQKNILGDPQKVLFEGSNASHNERIIQLILDNTAFTLKSNSTKGTNVKASIEVRLYYNNTIGSPNSNLRNAAESVVKILKGSISPSTGDILNSSMKPVSKDEDLINIVEVNLSDPLIQKSPSSKAIDAARNMTHGNSLYSVGEPKTDAVSKALFKYVIDCWVTFTNVQPDTPGVSS